MEKLVIKGGRVVNVESGEENIVDVLVVDGVIKDLRENLNVRDADVIDATGMYVLPGLIDVHVHTREPGFEYKEDIESVSKAAIHGGVTTLFAMPNTNPPIDSRALVEYVKRRGKEVGLIDIYPVGSITKGRMGKELAEIGDMVEGGAIGFSDDGNWVQDSGVMRRALEYARAFNTTIISHAEDRTLSQGVVHESQLSYEKGLEGYPAAAEEIAVYRDVKLAEITGGKLHIAHVSSKGSVEIIKEAREKGVRVTVEVTPNHLILAQENIDLFDPLYKVNPPIRTEAHRKALIKALMEGVINVIATDHAPHNWYEKTTDFNTAPWGMISLDFYFSLLYTELVLKGELPLHVILRATTLAPAEIFSLRDRGAILPGKRADIAIFDPEEEYILTEDFILSRSKNTPFVGKKLKGKFKKVIKAGRVINIEEWEK